MHFKQLEAFIKVIELSGFSKAADALYISQPSISAYINSLEKELGVVLINRSTKELTPTTAGKIFFENAKEIIVLRDNSIERLKNLSGNFSGEISIISSTVPSLYILPKIIAEFRGIYPDISFVVKQADTSSVVHGVAAQQHEIGFAGSVISDEKCVYEEFLTERLVFITPNNEMFGSPIKPSLQRLLYENTFVTREKGSGTRIEYEKYFKNQGIDLAKINTRIGFDNTQSVINAVMNGLGVSVVSEYAANDYIKRKMILSVDFDNLPERKIYFVLKRNISNSHLLDIFVDFLRSKNQ